VVGPTKKAASPIELPEWAYSARGMYDLVKVMFLPHHLPAHYSKYYSDFLYASRAIN
jgi:hypothetical protein